MPYVSGSDSVYFYLQHGFERVREEADRNIYSLYCNGDSAHRTSYGIQFSVDKRGKKFHMVKKKLPPAPTFALQSGNYEITEYGNYILNLGSQTFSSNRSDTSKFKISFEYGNDKLDEIYAYYSMPKSNHSYKVHEIIGWKPPRPTIIKKDKALIANGEMHDWSWYQLSGPDNTEVKKVGEGENFKPGETGFYCLAGRYGIGYAVSLPFYFKF